MFRTIVEMMHCVTSVCFVHTAVECASDATAAIAIITADSNSRFTAAVHSHGGTVRSAASAVVCCCQRSGCHSSQE